MTEGSTWTPHWVLPDFNSNLKQIGEERQMPLFLKPFKNARESKLKYEHVVKTPHVNTPINVEATVTNLSKADNVIYDNGSKHLRYAIEFYSADTLMGVWIYETAADRDTDYQNQLSNL